MYSTTPSYAHFHVTSSYCKINKRLNCRFFIKFLHIWETGFKKSSDMTLELYRRCYLSSVHQKQFINTQTFSLFIWALKRYKERLQYKSFWTDNVFFLLEAVPEILLTFKVSRICCDMSLTLLKSISKQWKSGLI